MVPSIARTPDAPSKHSRLVRALIWLAWGVLLIITLGFCQKYRERLYNFERLDPGYFNDSYQPYSDPPSYQGLSSGSQSSNPSAENQPPVESGGPESAANFGRIAYGRVGLDVNLRARQGDEWNRLSTASSVITATSAAALAIPGLAGPGSYWVVNTCFYSALGVSIEGLILVFYIQVMSYGASDETIGRLARGKVVLFGIEIPPTLPALIMGLPVVFATYSSLFLLVGTVAAVITSTWGPSTHFPSICYYLSLVPIAFGFVCMCGAVAVCEAGASQERNIRRRNAEMWRDKQQSLQDHAIYFGVRVAAAMLPLQQSELVGAASSTDNVRRRHALSASSGTPECKLLMTKLGLGRH